VPAEPHLGRRPFCAATSRERGESLTATASRVDHWILVEYRGGWSRDLIDGSLLSPELKGHLREQRDALGRGRVLFVRTPELRGERGRRVFLGSSRPGAERLVELEVEHQEDLLAFDLADLLAEGGPATALDGPLLVVCTHGKRDRCCAKYGRPLYDALREATEPERVWQSSHVGGDRFAGNVVVLPRGLYYGRVDPTDVDLFVSALAAGQIDLDRYRGCSAYPFPVQAAERAIRVFTGLLGVDDVSLVGSEKLGDGTTRARFQAGREVHEVDVVAALDDQPAFLTCSSERPRRARRCRVVGYRVLSP
jgi:hypothetical protein